MSAKSKRQIKCVKPKLTPLYFHSSHAWYAWLLYYKIQQFFLECVIMHECNNNFAFPSHSSIYIAILNIHCFFFPPTTTLYPPLNIRPVESGIIPDHFFFKPVEKLIPLTTTSQSGHDQPPLYFRPTYALPDQGALIVDPSIFPERERAGVDRLANVNGP